MSQIHRPTSRNVMSLALLLVSGLSGCASSSNGHMRAADESQLDAGEPVASAGSHADAGSPRSTMTGSGSTSTNGGHDAGASNSMASLDPDAGGRSGAGAAGGKPAMTAGSNQHAAGSGGASAGPTDAGANGGAGGAASSGGNAGGAGGDNRANAGSSGGGSVGAAGAPVGVGGGAGQGDPVACNDPATRTMCLHCTQDSDCTPHLFTPHCDVASSTCVDCPDKTTQDAVMSRLLQCLIVHPECEFGEDCDGDLCLNTCTP